MTITRSPTSWAAESEIDQHSRKAVSAAVVRSMVVALDLMRKVVRPEVNERVDRDDGVKVLRSEGERTGVGMDRKHAILDARITDALKVLRGAKPQVGGPHLHSKFASQKDRRHG